MASGNPFRTAGDATSSELSSRDRVAELFENSPIPRAELLQNLPLFINRQEMTRIVMMNELYRRIVGVAGVVMEFGVRWGRDLALFESFRGMYEPYNYGRKVIGFDSFEGFPHVHENDGTADFIEPGAYAVTDSYDDYLRQVLDYHESESPIPHIQKYDVVRGDVCETVPAYLEEHPETIVAFAYFDLDVYEPTRRCLEAIRDRVTRGTVLAFDELNCADFPGETVALRETFGLDKLRLERLPIGSFPAFAVIE